MLKITLPFESFLNIKGFTAEVVDSELTVWHNGLMKVYIVQRADGSDTYDVLFRKDNPDKSVNVEARFAIEKPEDIPPIEGFINMNRPHSAWEMRDR